MKMPPKVILLALLFVLMSLAAGAQTPPRLSIVKDSPGSVQISWSNNVGTSYRLLGAPNLTNRLALWTPLEDVFSGDTKVSVSLAVAGTNAGFFGLQIPANGTSPAVQIFSPANNQIASGITAIRAGAQITNQLLGVNLYLDGVLAGFIDSGGIEFNFDTTHFGNGQHTVYVGAVDLGNHEFASSSVTLDFENPVRWLDADSLFQSFVPVDVVSDIYPATWNVFVSDTNGTIVRTFSGTTSDGNINTSWDGNDNNGNYAPDQAAYSLSVVVNSSSSGNAAMSYSSSASTPSFWVLSITPNAYGVMEYQVQEPASDPMVTYSNLLQNYLQMPESDRIIFPSFAPAGNEPNLPPVKKLSAYDMFMRQHPVANKTSASNVATPNGSSTASSGSTSARLWREADWSSGQIILARVNIPGIYNSTIQNYLVNLRTAINAAATDTDAVGNNRETFQNAVFVLNNSGDFTTLTNNLAVGIPDVRELYLFGHGSTNGNYIGTDTGTGVRAKDLAAVLGNRYAPTKSGSPPLFITTKPFDFVFLDGCMTGKGSLPEAFGIPKAVSGAVINEEHLHKRAFMGWAGTINIGLSPESFNWTQSFWNTWIHDTPYDITLAQAQAEAYRQHPSGGDGAPIETYGNLSLTWAYHHQ